MHNSRDKAFRFIESLLEHPKVKDLDNHDDQGVSVSTHTYDVLKSCEEELLKNSKNIEQSNKKLDFFAIIVGIIIHDLSKGSIRKDGEGLSHSQMMIKKPEYIAKESEKILEEIEIQENLKIRKSIIKNIIHIVLSHHGRWGKVQPGSREAHLVHKSDEYSAKYHRITPIGADKILKLMEEGLSIEEISEKLVCTMGILKDRLKRAKQELGMKNTKQLISYYKKNRKVPLGDSFFEQRIRETDRLINLVNKKGFKKLILENKLMEKLEDSKIFQVIK